MAEDYVAKLIAQSFGRVDVQHKVGVDYLLCPTHGPDDDLAVPKDFEIGNTVTVAISQKQSHSDQLSLVVGPSPDVLGPCKDPLVLFNLGYNVANARPAGIAQAAAIEVALVALQGVDPGIAGREVTVVKNLIFLEQDVEFTPPLLFLIIA